MCKGPVVGVSLKVEGRVRRLVWVKLRRYGAWEGFTRSQRIL